MSSSSNTNSDTHDRSSLSRLGSLRSLRNSATATALAAAQRLESLHPELRQAYERVLKNDRPEQQHVEEDFYINITMKGEPLPSSAESHTDADETYVSSGTDYDDESIKVAKIVEDTTRSNKEEHKDDEEPMIVHRVDSSYGADVDKVDSVMDDSPCESSIEQEKPGLLRCSSAPSCPAAHIMITEEVRRINEVVIVEEGAQENTMVNKSAPTTTTTTPPSTVATIESQPEEPLLPTNDDERAKEVTDEKAASTTDEQPEEEPLQTDEEEPLKDDESEEEAPISREPPGILATQEACWVDETSTEYSEDESSQTPFYIEDEEEKDGGMSFEELISPQQSYFSEVQELSSNEIDEDAVIDSSQQPGGAKLSDDDASSVAAGKTGYDVDCQDEASGLYQAEDAISVELNYDNNADHDAEADGLVAVMLKDSVTKEDLARAARTTTSIAPVIKRTDKETTNSNSAAALPQPEKTKVEVETNDKPQSNSSSAANVRSTTVECQEKLQEEKKKAAVKPEKKESVQERCNSSPKKNKPNKYPVAYGQSARKSTSKKTKTVKRTGPVDLDVSWHSNSSETTEFILNDLQEDRLLEEYEASIAAAAKIETNSEEHKKCRTLLASAATTTIHTAEAPKRSEVLESSVAIVESNADASIQKVKHAGKRETRERSMAKVAPTAEASIPKAEPPLPTEFESRERQLNDSSLRSMPLEAVLMRRFDLKFQEAASLVADARINMGGGSPSWVPWTNELYEECEKLYKLKYCGDDEHEEEKVVIMNWPKFLAPVDGLRAPTHADFASSSGNSTDSAASSCLESSTGWSSVWDENDGDFSVATHDREDEYSVGVIQELKQNHHESEGEELVVATFPSMKSSKGKSSEARRSKKSKSKSRSSNSKSKAENPKKLMRRSSSMIMLETEDLGIMPPTTIQDDEASKEFSDISNMSENLVLEKPSKLSKEQEIKGRQADETSVKSTQKAHPSEAASLKSKQKPTTATPPSQFNQQSLEQAVPLSKAQSPQQKRGLFSMLRCCTTNDAVVVVHSSNRADESSKPDGDKC